MGKSLLKVFLLSMFYTTVSMAADLTSYGDLYLIEEKKEIITKSYEMGLSTGVVSNHPIFNIETVGLSVKKRWNLTWRTGIKYLFSNVHESDSTKLINTQLEKESKAIKSNYPKNMILAEFDFLAFIGHLNFMELNRVSTTSGLSLEAGRTIDYDEDLFVLNPKFIYELGITQDFSSGLYVGQRFFMNEGRESFTELGLNISFRI